MSEKEDAEGAWFQKTRMQRARDVKVQRACNVRKGGLRGRVTSETKMQRAQNVRKRGANYRDGVPGRVDT